MKILKPDQESFKLAAQAIRNGEVIVVPTDAVYAVVCDAANEQAVARLRNLRQSPSDKPLSLIIDKNEIEKYCIIKNNLYRQMIDLSLPGKVSFLLNKITPRFDFALSNTDSICVFWQDNETRRLYQQCQCVLAISSANKTGQPEATTLDQAIDYFGDEISIYIDSGEERGNKGTTQLDIRSDIIKVMRESPLFTIEKLKKTLESHGLNLNIQEC